jgi:two-component system, sensor histidine kinase and response regulator
LPTPTRILLIDDDPDERAALVATLAGSNLVFSLAEAGDMETGLAAARGGDFDCVLLDSRLPGADLADFVATLSAAEGGRQAVIALTDDADDALALLRAGALDSISRDEATPHNLARAIRYAKSRRGFVIEMQAAREDAEAKSRALDRLNRQTTLILSIIAHDLRNPFQVLLGMSELLARTAASGQAGMTARRAGIVHEAAAQAHGLMESLFSWASLRMDARAESAALRVDALFEAAERALGERAAAKGVRIVAPPTEARVLAQEDALAAILRNLIANAVKFTEAGGEVRLSAARRGGQTVVSVADTGVGMSEDQVSRLFQIESRATSAGTASERGAGLGLLLCRDLADWIGGALDVESRLGEGTTFRLTLPSADAA